MRTVLTVALCTAFATGCLRVDFEGADGPFISAVEISDPISITRCPVSVATANDGKSYGVVWSENAEGDRLISLMFARVSSSGQLLAGPTTIDTFDKSLLKVNLFPGTANSSEGFTTIYTCSGDSDRRHEVLQIDPEGDVLSIVDGGSYPGNSEVVANDSGFAVFSQRDYEVFMTTLDPNGEPLVTEAPVDLPLFGAMEPTVENFDVVATSSGYHMVAALAWGASVIYAHLDGAGAIANAMELDFGSHHSPQIASDGAGRLAMAWFDSGSLTEYSIAEGGADGWVGVRQSIVPNRSASSQFDLSGGDGRVALAWRSDAEELLPQIMVQSYELDSGAAPQAQLLSDTTYGFSCPQVAFAGGEFSVAFRGAVDGSQQLFVDTNPE
jgi:hypothetical protein